MSRWTSRLLCLLLMLASVPPSVRADEVDVWLTDRGLDRLLAQHLEQQLNTLQGESRTQGAIRLARLYAQLLSDTDDRAARISLEERGRRLLGEVSGSAADQLQLELSHGTYLGLEQTAEQHRIRLLNEAQLGPFQDRLDALITTLKQLRKRIDASLGHARRTAGTRTSRRPVGRSRLNTLEEMSDRIDFLLGWCHYYRAWLTGNRADAETAERHFGMVLELEEFTPADVSIDLRREHAIAWTIIGMAMANAETSTAASALRWLDLLDLPSVPQDIRDQLTGWRLAVLLEHARFEDAGKLLNASRNALGRVPVAWIRMAAVRALEDPNQAGADELAGDALAQLASLGELGQIQDIVKRYGDAVDGDRFPFAYARAIIEYRFAKALEDRKPIADEVDRRHAWRLALSAIESALSAPDVASFGSARHQAQLLRAWSVYALEQFEMASGLFEQAAEALAEDEAAEAIWMAYVAQERHRQQTPQTSPVEMERLVELYLERFPRGPRAGELMVRRASRGETPTPERVKELLRVPLDSPARAMARMRAADMLYRLFRSASGPARLEAAEDYLVHAVPMMQADYGDTGTGQDNVSGARAVARARRVLEVSADPDVLRLVAADSALLILFNRESLVSMVDEDLEDEIDYRRILLALARSQPHDAQAIADVLYGRHPEVIWSRLATRRMLEQARLEAAVGGSDVREARLRIVRNGDRILGESPSLLEALQVRSGLSIGSVVAEAAEAMWREGGDAAMGEHGFTLYGGLLEVMPRNRRFLAGRGRLASGRGDPDEALRCWRIVTAGSRTGSDEWFEARTWVVEILETVDPDRAREVLTQHQALHPDSGPQPWGERLRQAALRLGVAGSTGDARTGQEDSSEPHPNGGNTP